ncbi:hypothetical protein [Rheinheimera sp.]|uniref:hypothetical protein n=1 Tax=Rheinheimera sp. TaxID=1869214 RepID=UPI0040483F4F
MAQQSQQFTQTGTVASNPNAAALDFRLQPTYAEGGMVGPNGMPMAPAGMGGQEQAMSPQMLEINPVILTRLPVTNLCAATVTIVATLEVRA